MAPEDLMIHTASGLVLRQQLPYRSGPLAISRHDHTLLIEALAPDTELSVHPSPEGIVLRIEATRYTLALAKTEMLHIRTGAGDDNVFVESTLDSRIVIETGEGNDRIRIEGQLPPDGQPLNAGSVIIDAGAGDDHVVVEGGRQAEIDGGKGNDALHSVAAHSTLYAGAGDDVVRVNAGNRMVSRKHETLQKVGNGLLLVHEVRRQEIPAVAGSENRRARHPVHLPSRPALL